VRSARRSRNDYAEVAHAGLLVGRDVVNLDHWWFRNSRLRHLVDPFGGPSEIKRFTPIGASRVITTESVKKNTAVDRHCADVFSQIPVTASGGEHPLGVKR
jgi:hypothetical protein